jgi:steroid 5-alpha reductase family enzyme
MTLSLAIFTLCLEVGFEMVNSLVFSVASLNPLFSENQFYVSMSIFLASVAVELAAELQLAAFKSKAGNRGSLCATGF